MNIIRKWIIKFLLRFIDNKNLEDNCYIINIENTNDTVSKAVIFGHNLFCNEENFGSDKGVVVSTPYSSYQQVLYESQLHTEIISLRVTTSEIKNKLIGFNEKLAFGRSAFVPIRLIEYLSPIQFQKNIVDIPERFQMHGATYFEFDMMPKEKMTIVFFGKKKETHNILDLDI